MLTATVFVLMWVSIPEPETNFACCEPSLPEMCSLTAGLLAPNDVQRR